MTNKRLGLIIQDPWLEGSEQDIEARQLRYQDKLRHIENEFGSLKEFSAGTEYFGIHNDPYRKAWVYREWAPGANELYLIGDFNGWRKFTHPLKKNAAGIWEIFLEHEKYKDLFKHGSLIKVLVVSDAGSSERIPAYIRRVVQDEQTKNFTGQVWLPGVFDWQNDDFKPKDKESLLIYECHVGMAQEKEGVGTYEEFTKVVLPRVKKLGYNAIQLMAIQEHPYYGSFGYHVSNFFAASSRFGTPEALKELIRTAHQMGIAVIMDLVHSHTVKNVLEGLNEFDGTDHQYFHAGERGLHPQWDSMLFDYGKQEVMRFLLSNVAFWLQEFHFDGFRFDGVGSMLYFHHGNESFNERSKYFTDGVEWDAVTYLQLANKLIHNINPAAISIAEDVTGMPGLTFSVDEGGLGFDYRLGMGIPDFWIKILKDQTDESWQIGEMWQVLNDRLPYVKTVAYCESHDQALVGDKTIAFRLMDKEMYEHMSLHDPDIIVDRGMALHKMIRFFTVLNGGQAYLTFMGNEFGHPEWIDFPREGNNWSFLYARRQWSLAENKNLKYQFLEAFEIAMIKLVKEYKLLSGLYATQLNLDEENKTIVLQKEGLIFVFNFHASASIPDYSFYVPEAGKYQVILNSDDPAFGGHGRIDPAVSYFTVYDNLKQINILKIYATNRSCLVFKKIG